MSEFVNYSKRSVTLPKGCKDLIDVLKQGSMSASEPLPDTITQSGPSRVGGMAIKVAEMEKYSERVFASAAQSVVLRLTSTDEQITVVFCRHPKARTAAVTFKPDPASEDLMVALFERHGLQKPKNLKWPTFGGMLPQSPLSNYVLYEFLPTPVDTVQFCQIARDIFRNVLELTEEDVLEFRYVLIDKT